MQQQHKEKITQLFVEAVAPLIAEVDLALPSVTLERPRDAAHGDLACNIAMQLAKPLKRNPRELAQAIAAAVLENPARRGLVESIDIAGPGFINLRLALAAKQTVIQRVFIDAQCYGRTNLAAGSKVLVEFVSANPKIGRAHF